MVELWTAIELLAITLELRTTVDVAMMVEL
jgi:hypothetical protein